MREEFRKPSPLKALFQWLCIFVIIGSIGYGVHHGVKKDDLVVATDNSLIKSIEVNPDLRGTVTNIDIKDGIRVAEIKLLRKSPLNHAVVIGELAVGDLCQIISIQHTNKQNHVLDTLIARKVD